MSREAIEKLIQKYVDGNCNEKESAIVEAWYNELADQPHDIHQAEVDSAEETLLVNLKTYIGNKDHIKLWPRIAAVASIVICIGIGFYFYQKSQTTPTEITAKNDIAPGGNKAFLTLGDGKRIVLTDVKKGELAEQSGVKITKAADGQLIYTVSNRSNENNKISTYNTIETPRGGTYQVRLPDGTRVWLNAASTIKYPVSFASRQERRVQLLGGEAYFEVAKDKKHPFIVQTNQQEVEVLGTHFNINNYSDESFTKTTLLEGSVRVSPVGKDGTKDKSIVLKPKEQALLSGKSLKVTEADTEEAVAWKSGYFKFQNEPIESVMRKIARWYNVKVEYSGSIPTRGLGGTMSRGNDLSKVLNMLQKTGLVKLRINGNTVIVSK